MPYTTDAVTAQDGTFRGRVQIGMVKIAQAVASEARTVRNVVDDKRNILARDVLNNPATFLDRFVFAAITAGSLTTASTDANIDSALSAAWNGLAGVTPEELA